MVSRTETHCLPEALEVNLESEAQGVGEGTGGDGNISGGEITTNGKRSAKMPTFLMPPRLTSVVGKRRR